jgi:hypothetical protein
MVLSQTSVLGKLAGITRRVTLTTNPTYSTSTGSWLVNGLDADKQQWQIDLTVLPPGVSRDHIQAGQVWFIERQTTYNRLFKYVGNFVVQNQLRMSTTLASLSQNTWSNVTFNSYLVTQSGVAGITTYSGGIFYVPFPGFYSVTSYLTTTSGTILNRIYSSTLNGNYPTSNYTSTEILCLTSGNLSLSIQGNPTATSQITGYASITYAGPIISN